jgi:hypothetical protein
MACLDEASTNEGQLGHGFLAGLALNTINTPAKK